MSSDAANRIDGRGGSDTVSYDLSVRGQLINLAGGAATDGVATDTLLSIENAIGSELSDVMHGNALDNILDGGAGGSDQINGADGSDTASYAFSRRGVLINLASQATVDGVDSDTLSSIENAIGSKFADRIVAGADANRLEGSDGNDTFVFRRGHANSDIVVDFNGNGGAAGNSFELIGFGTLADGASLTQLDGTHWRINSADGSAHEIITLTNGAIIDQSDFVFI